IADLAKEMEFERVFLIGENFWEVQSYFQKFKSFDDLRNFVGNNPPKKGSILIKGSRGMALERVLDLL
ncbi:MAG: UDP-N-acetylmuramoyl-tripeptide--D-alanyl-D-alanine ligase, partial [Allomuricauda sp.]